MKLLLIAATVLHLTLGASISDVTCPDSCTCQVMKEQLETSCISYEFIKKLIPKQVSTIVRLNINNASLVNIDSKLKYLKNLHVLDLSNNQIKSLPSQFPYLPKLKYLNLSNNDLTNINFAQLPKNLEIVDLSNNPTGNFPKDWTILKQLKTIHFHDNPIDCDCNNLLIYEQILEDGINISDNLTCHYPKEFYGKLLNSVNCSLIKENLLNAMLGDEAGSGLEELETANDNSPLSNDQDQLMIAEGITEHPEEELDEEGSGDEGSGDTLFISEPKACYFNCSTPPPVGNNDEVNSSYVPDIREDARVFVNDLDELNPFIDDKDRETITTTTPTPPPKEEEPFIKETDKSNAESLPTNPKHEVESVPTNQTQVRELEETKVADSSTQSVYIIVGLLIAFVAFLIIYVMNKRRNRNKRNQRKRNKSNENGFGEELKPLGKSAEAAKPVEQIKLTVPNAEGTPLLNGQNGKISDEVKPQPTEEDTKDLEEVEVRKPEKQELLTPQPERVTIKAGELPDSVPKTPLLVHRQVNSDGEIVTTAVNSN